MSKNIHILSISHSFLRKINTSIYSVLKKKYDFKIKLICPNYHIESRKKIFPDYSLNELDVDVIFEKTIFNHLRLKIYKNLFSILKKEKNNFVFLDMDIISLQSLMLIFYSFFFNYKIYYFSNENNIIDEKSLIKKNIKKIIYKLINFFFKKKILKIFCYTNQIKKNLDYCGFEKQTTLMPLGFDDKKFKKIDKINTNSKFIISYFGKIEKKKGIHTLLKALKLIEFDDWIFHLDIFDIQSLNYFRLIKPDLIHLRKINKLKLIKCSHNNINTFMQRTDLTIVPSEWNEQYGRVIQESAACGSIVIGSKIGAIPEILVNEKLTFDPGNINSLKEKIEEIYYNYNVYRKLFNEVEDTINKKRTIYSQAEIINNNIV